MKARFLFRDIASRITGLSTPIFGISWEPPEIEREIAKSVINFLEDKRVLYNPMDLENLPHCISSISAIRQFLTEKMGLLNPNSELAKNLRMMRAACRKFLDSTQKQQLALPGRYYGQPFYTSLGELRGIFGFCLSQIVLSFGLDIEEDLASILPADEK